MRTFLLSLTAAAVALGAEPEPKLVAPILGYVFDGAAKAIRPITGIPGSASLDAALPSASKLANGFVLQNGPWLLAILLDGGVQLVNLQSGVTTTLEGASADAALGTWSADGTAIALWSRSGVLQVWTGLPDAPSLSLTRTVGPVSGMALGARGESALLWSDDGLAVADASGVRQLASEPVRAAAYRGDSAEWAAVTSTQLLRAEAEPRPLQILDPAAVAFLRAGILVAGKGGVETIGEAGSILLPCECSASALDRLAGSDVFRMTGANSNKLTLYDGSGGEPALLYIPTEGGR